MRPDEGVGPGFAWEALLALRAARSERRPAVGVGRGPLTIDGEGNWHCDAAVDPVAAELLDLFAPIAAAGRHRPLAIAHLGQSLDGRIATESGNSHYIGGLESLCHLHRLRALVDAVVVGAATAVADDPRLTVRHVSGPDPVRVVLDPNGRVPATARLFTGAGAGWRLSRNELDMPVDGAVLPPDGVLAWLRDRDCAVVLVEGGGATVSRFVAAGALAWLELAVAPLLIGSGRPALVLAPIDRLSEAIRPPTSVHRLGRDTLFRCHFERSDGAGNRLA